jgi:hypothetical protein
MKKKKSTVNKAGNYTKPTMRKNLFNRIKTIRFGQQGVKGAGKNPTSKKDKARKRSYYARHNAQDSSPSKLSARYWSHKVKW